MELRNSLTSGQVIAEFASPVEAVRSAVGIQIELEKRNAELPEDRRMRFRIGINLGDVTKGETDCTSGLQPL